MSTAILTSPASNKPRAMNIPPEAAKIGLARAVASHKARGAAHIAAVGPRVIRLRKLGMTMQQIADVFNEEGMKTPTGMRYAVTQIGYLICHAKE